MNYQNYIDYLKTNNLYEKVQGRTLNSTMCPNIVNVLLKHNPKNILEIGRFKGHTLGLFRFICPDSIVTSVDIVTYKESVTISDHFDNCKLIKGTSNEVVKLDTKFDFVLIDGDHSYKGAKNDWLNIQKNLSPNAVVVFDDLGHGQGCGKAFYELKGYDKEIFKLKDGGDALGVVYLKG